MRGRYRRLLTRTVYLSISFTYPYRLLVRDAACVVCVLPLVPTYPAFIARCPSLVSYLLHLFSNTLFLSGLRTGYF